MGGLQSVMESGCSKVLEFHQIYIATVSHTVRTHYSYMILDMWRLHPKSIWLGARPSDVGNTHTHFLSFDTPYADLDNTFSNYPRYIVRQAVQACRLRAVTDAFRTHRGQLYTLMGLEEYEYRNHFFLVDVWC